MADETPAASPAKPVKTASVTLATDYGHQFRHDGLGIIVVHGGTVVTSEQADELRTVAQKMGINITVKDA